MPGPYRARVFGVLAKIESTSGTDAVPVVGTDAVKTVGIPMLGSYEFLETGERDDVQTGVLIATDKAPAAGRFAKIEITMEVRGGGSAGASPECDPFLRAAGFSKTVNAGVSVLYTTIDTGMETMTLYLYTANKLIKLVGCVVSFKLSAETPKRGFFTFSVTGKVASDPTEVTMSALTTSSVDPSMFHTAAASIGSWLSSAASDPLVLKTLDVSDNAQIEPRAGAGATDGLIGFILTDRKMRQAMSVEVPALATFDPYALAIAVGSSQPVSLWQIGSAVGKRVKGQTGRWSIKAPAPGATGGINTYPLDGTLGPGAPTSARELNLLWD